MPHFSMWSIWPVSLRISLIIGRFPVRFHWRTRPGFQTWTRYEAPGDFRVELDNVQWLRLSHDWGCLLVSWGSIRLTELQGLFSCRSLPGILKHRDHRYDIQLIRKAGFLHIMKISAKLYKNSGSQFIRATTGTQSGPGAFHERQLIMIYSKLTVDL